ncbi:MAG: hypothetical protein HY909_31275 [Deltaproteobacteria bacterium]|nr:hypothetical protein [Deltaproteobacteria bacterium]
MDGTRVSRSLTPAHRARRALPWALAGLLACARPSESEPVRRAAVAPVAHAMPAVPATGQEGEASPAMVPAQSTTGSCMRDSDCVPDDVCIPRRCVPRRRVRRPRGSCPDVVIPWTLECRCEGLRCRTRRHDGRGGL